MPSQTIAIIDYGSGNLRSAAKAFERVADERGLDIRVIVTNQVRDLARAAKIILPGQGAFGDCMAGIEAIEGMPDALENAVIRGGKPFLGICVGMQLLATRGLEYGVHAGFNWIPGQVVPMRPADPALKIPHMGWNELDIPAPGPQDNRHPVLRSRREGDHYYFVHSFMFECEDQHHILAWTEYGGAVPAAVGRDNIVGVQFHPEKSQKAGLRLIGDFLEWEP